MILRDTVFPASLIRLTMSEWDLLVMEQPLTDRMRSPTFSFPQRSAGLPSMMRPILWGMATHAFPAFCVCVIQKVCDVTFCGKGCCLKRERGEKGQSYPVTIQLLHRVLEHIAMVLNSRLCSRLSCLDVCLCFSGGHFEVRQPGRQDDQQETDRSKCSYKRV